MSKYQKLFLNFMIIMLLLVICDTTKNKDFFTTYNPRDIIMSDKDNYILQDSFDKSIIAKVYGLDIYGKRYNNKLDFSGLGDTAKKRNKKSVGWIRVPGVIINYPIMYATENSYYLKHTSAGNVSVYGAIFLEAASEGQWSKINLIHGHNMNDGAMFGDLDKYRDKSWTKKHENIYITEDDGYEYEYKVFSVFTLNGNKEKITISCKSDAEYSAYFEKLSNLSMHKLSMPSTDSRIAILNTCSYAYNGEHLIVCAYRKEKK